MRLLKKGYVRASHTHKIYFELRGKKNGKPAVYLHGGPGSHFHAKHFKVFPKNFCALFFDQRGCGRSKPLGEIRENTTQLLVQDICTLMDHVGFEKATIVGGSWGSTLALCFAIAHPQRVEKLALRGIYLGTKQENEQFKKTWELFSPEIFLSAEQTPTYQKNPSARMVQHLAWLEYSLLDNSKTWQQIKKPRASKANWIGSHYISNNCFLPANYILKNTQKISHIPTVIVQGAQDLVCPPLSAWKLSQKIPKAKFILVSGGHRIPNGAQILKANLKG